MDSYWPHPTDTAQHDGGELARILNAKITTDVIDVFVERITDVVDYGLRRPSSSNALPNSNKRVRQPHDQQREEFTTFVSRILRRAEVTMSVILGALAYLDRAKPHLRIAIEEWAHHRVFLGSLIVASKYLNDSSLKNSHWALCTGVFGKRDIARIEREFLEVLAFQCSVHEKDLAPQVEAVRSAMTPEAAQLKKMRQADMERKEMEAAHVRDGLAARRRELRSRRPMESAATGHSHGVGSLHHHHYLHRPYPLSRSNSPRKEWTHHRGPSPLVPTSPISPCDSLGYASSSSSSSSLSTSSSSSSPCTPPSAASSLLQPPVFVPSQSHATSPYYTTSPPSAINFSKSHSGGVGNRLNMLERFPSLPVFPRFPVPPINTMNLTPSSSRPSSALPPSLAQASFVPPPLSVPLPAQPLSASASMGSGIPMSLYPSCVPFSSGSSRPSPMLPISSAVPMAPSFSNGSQPVVIPRSSASFAAELRRVPVL